ncbi:NUDIX hydrolase [Tardiphaga sp.]|uniref:NUDIX hydrolase n=1 Tax=Tardiphaga sp. TaxID=1926292 RepID=UPI0026121F2C|nr:NUDIX hydrolase [Tardiphaga sp.]MDB5617771.1 hydrolase [Tardiphaga sp.]
MQDEWPKILSRQTVKVSPWVELVAREVEFTPGEPSQVYHAIAQQDYLAIVALTPDGRFPIVRQYRPALEMFTWELPAGLAEPGEDHGTGCARELLEETGYPARAIHPLGSAAPCSGRFSNRIHSFFLQTGERIDDFVSEPGLSVDLATPAELVAMIMSGELIQQLHLGALLLAELRGFITLPRQEPT